MGKVLIVIDLQNDYFPGGNFPLWNAERVLSNAAQAIHRAHQQSVPVILVQHVVESAQGVSPFFQEGTRGVELHPAVRAAAPDAPVVVKHFADAFVNTGLAQLLTRFDATELLICGMMTQNCVTHTALSKDAEGYAVTLLPDCCTTVDAMIHGLALRAIATRVTLSSSTEAFGASASV